MVFSFFVPVPIVIVSALLDSWSERAQWAAAAALGTVILPVPLWGFAEIYRRLRRLDIEALGFGDVKLMAAIGAFFGLEGTIPVLMIAAVLGAVFGLVQVAARGRAAWRMEMPFGSFLCASAAVWVFRQ
jgi:leader peptidase (prepilin peptidase)/N-methyltransferase